MPGKRIKACLICGGKYHDFDFARLELLKLLAENDRLRVQVLPDYRDTGAIRDADLLVTYTCDLVPDASGVAALEDFVASGRRWFALHGTNSILRFANLKPLIVTAPRIAPEFMRLLGGQFIAHPPVGRYTVQVSDPSNPLVRGIEPFETEDELYLQEYHGDNRALLHCEFRGTVPDFEENDWSRGGRQLVFWLHPHGAGEVLYLTLGHCRGRYDMLPLMEEYPRLERGSWNLPVYSELLRRGLRWAAHLD
jgi:hypothetical protein